MTVYGDWGLAHIRGGSCEYEQLAWCRTEPWADRIQMVAIVPSLLRDEVRREQTCIGSDRVAANSNNAASDVTARKTRGMRPPDAQTVRLSDAKSELPVVRVTKWRGGVSYLY